MVGLQASPLIKMLCGARFFLKPLKTSALTIYTTPTSELRTKKGGRADETKNA